MRWSIAAGHRVQRPCRPDARRGAAAPYRGPGQALRQPAPRPRSLPTLAEARRITCRELWRPTVACLRFLAATATRSGEARFATWVEIDLDTRTWTVPARAHQDQPGACSAAVRRRRSPRSTRLAATAAAPGRCSPRRPVKVLSNGAMSKLTRHFGVHASRTAGLVPIVGSRDREFPERSPRPRSRTRPERLEQRLPTLRPARPPAERSWKPGAATSHIRRHHPPPRIPPATTAMPASPTGRAVPRRRLRTEPQVSPASRRSPAGSPPAW